MTRSLPSSSLYSDTPYSGLSLDSNELVLASSQKSVFKWTNMCCGALIKTLNSTKRWDKGKGDGEGDIVEQSAVSFTLAGLAFTVSNASVLNFPPCKALLLLGIASAASLHYK